MSIFVPTTEKANKSFRIFFNEFFLYLFLLYVYSRQKLPILQFDSLIDSLAKNKNRFYSFILFIS